MQPVVQPVEHVGWITLNMVPTCVKTWGGWIEDNIASDSVILFVPATPGVTDFYDKFLATLYANLKVPVWVVGHAGLQVPPASKNLVLPCLKENPHLYNLDGQIKHKKEFILRYIPANTSVHMIGHSIGAKICIELMRDEEIAARTKQIHLLFPAIQQLANTPKGWQFTKIWNPLVPILVIIAYIFSSLPYFVRYLLVRIALTLRMFILYVEPCYINAVIKLCNPKSTRCVFFLGESGMLKVRDLDDDVIREHREKIRAYFSASDSWVPLSHYESLREQHPYIKSILLEPNYWHDFIVKSSVQMANTISNEFNSF